jgi:SAM-dependent methyltransferase
MSEPPNAQATTESFEFEALEKAANYRAAVLDEFRPFLRGRVLEVGAGIGQFTGELAAVPTIAELVSVEPDARFCARFRQMHPGRSLVQGTVEAVPVAPPWDALVSVNVLEHIQDDAGELVRWHQRLCGCEGYLCLFVPARQEIYATLDRDFGHFRRYQRSELRRKLTSAGFSVRRLHYFNCVGYVAWWMNFCLLKKRHFDVGAVSFFDRVIFPVVHLVESRAMRPPIGQSLLAVAQARAAGELPP